MSDKRKVSRRQLLAAGAGVAGVAAGAGILGGRPLAETHAAEGIQDATEEVLLTAPANITIAVRGSKQGQLKGDSAKTNLMKAYAVSFDLSVPYDAASGQTSGRRSYTPIVVTKLVGPATPQLLLAASSNEVLTTVAINFSRKKVYYHLTLSNALIVNFNQYVNDTEASNYQSLGGLKLLEDVSFIFEKITVNNIDGNTTFNDDWEFPSP